MLTVIWIYWLCSENCIQIKHLAAQKLLPPVMSCHAVGYIHTNTLEIYDFLFSGEAKTWEKNTAGSIYNCTAKDVDVTTLSRRTSTVVNGTLLEQ
jgi:hypothetical protein